MSGIRGFLGSLHLLVDNFVIQSYWFTLEECWYVKLFHWLLISETNLIRPLDHYHALRVVLYGCSNQYCLGMVNSYHALASQLLHGFSKS